MLKMKNDRKSNTNETPSHRRVRDLALAQELPQLDEICMSLGCTISHPNKKELHHFYLTMCPRDGYWVGQSIQFDVTVPDEYPHNPPSVICKTPVWHPNINEEGKVCLSILRSGGVQTIGANDGWTPTQGLKGLVLGLYSLFFDLASFDDPLNVEAAEQYKTNKNLFIHNVQNYARR